MDENQKVGAYIKSLREKSGMSQHEVAEKMFISRQAVSNWENGKHLPDFDNFKLLAALFNVDVSDLINGGEVTTSNEKEHVFLKFISKMNEDKKKIVKRFCMVIVLLVLLFLTYYFINSYKSLKIYTVSYEQEEFEINGVLVLSRKDTYLNIDVTNLDVESMELYTKNNDQEERIIKTSNPYIQIKDKVGYSTYLNYNNIDKKKNNLYLKIKTNQNEEINIQLYVTKFSENNNLWFSNKEGIDEKDNPESEYKIPEKIKKEFTYENGVYTLNKKDKKKEIAITLNSNLSLFKVNEAKAKDSFVWTLYLNSNTLKYEKYKDDMISETYNVDLNNETEPNEETKYFIDNYLNVYLKYE